MFKEMTIEERVSQATRMLAKRKPTIPTDEPLLWIGTDGRILEIDGLAFPDKLKPGMAGHVSLCPSLVYVYQDIAHEEDPDDGTP